MADDTGSASPIWTEYTDGVPRIAYDRCGDGETVLFLHGIGGNRTNWRDQLPAVGERYRAVAWDARGWGLSDDYDGALSFDIFNDDLIRLLDHLKADTATMVGLSMGGRIAQHFYNRHADRVAAVVLCDTLERPERTSDPAFRAKFLADRQAPLLAGKTPRDIAPALAASLASAGCTPANMAKLVESLSTLRTASYLKALNAVAQHDEISRLPAFAVPVLLLYGDEDRLTTPATGRALAERIPGSQFHIIGAAGHLSNIEQPERFNALLLRFLDDNLPRAARRGQPASAARPL